MYSDLNELYGKYGKNVAKAIYQEESTGTHASKKSKKQGYNARLDESLGARNGKKSQSMKSRRKESKGMEKSMGKKAYSGNRYSS